MSLYRVRKSIPSFVILLLLCSTQALFAQTYIFGQLQLPVGTWPESIATGDFNNDGILDMVVVNLFDGTVSVLLGKPNGTFAPQVVYPVGTQPIFVAVADFNGDGNLDLAVVNENCAGEPFNVQSCGTGTVSILLGNGDGTFQPHFDYDTGTQPVWVAAADLNGDGKPDLVVVNFDCLNVECNSNDGSGSVSILLGNGDGTFQPQVQYGTQSAPLAVVIADFNGDNKLDLGVAVRGCGGNCDGGLSVLLGNGDGTFQNHIDCGTQSPGGSIVAADFNGDGKLDVAIGGSTTSILLGNGDGTFVYDGSYSSGGSYQGAVGTRNIVAADLNGDGKLDLVSNGSVLVGNGDGTFQPAVAYGPAYGGSNSNYFLTSSTLADFNGDGKPDLAFTTYDCSPQTYCLATSPGFVTIVLGLGNGVFVGPTSFSAPGLYSDLITADFNGDGHLDLAGEGGTTDVFVLLGNGDGTFQPEIETSLSSMSGNLVAGSFKSPSETDLATVVSTCTQTSCPPGNAAVLLGNGDGTFQTAVDYLVGAGPVAIAAGDFNGDGSLDLAVSNSVSNSVSILLGNGDGTFGTHVDYPASTPGPIIAGDFNGDGKLDLAFISTPTVNGNTSTQVGIMLGNGDGTFQTEVNYGVGQGPVSIAIADFNGDGKLDVAVAGLEDLGLEESGIVSVLLGNGDGTFQPYVTYLSPGDVALSVADFNGDGIPDLVMGMSFAPNAAVLLGNGDGTFQSPLIYTVGTTNESAGAIAVGDFNGDGLPDLAGPYATLLSIAFRAVSPTALNFGSQGVGTTSLAQVLTISNPSNVQFDINSIAASGSFGQTNNCGPTLKPGTNCTVNVTFSPAATGPQQGAITITDSTQTSPQSIVLTGTGVSGSFLTAYPSRADFAPQMVGTKSAAAAVTLVNTGSTSLTLSSISIAGSDTADFNQTNTCVSSLPAGGNCVADVIFAPSAAGTRTAQLTVTDSASNSPQLINLVGTGLDFQISATAFSPGTITAGASSTSTVTIAPLDGFNSAVTLSCSGLVSGVTCSFNPPSLTPSSSTATSILTVTTAASVAASTYSVTIVAASGLSSHNTSESLIVQAALPNFTIGAASGSPTSATVSPGQSANFSLTVTPAFAFTASVSLSCTISPAVTTPPTCNVPSSLQLSGGTPASVNVTLATVAASTAATGFRPGLPPGTMPLLWWAVLMMSGLVLLRGRRRFAQLGLPVLILSLVWLYGCGGGGSSSHGGGTSGTPAGTYTATVTATNGSTSHSMSLTVVVN